MSKNQRCIFVASTQAAALGLSHWLASHGVDNTLVDKTTLGISYGVSFTSNDPAGDGWQVWINNLDQLDQAKTLLDERERQKAEVAKQGPIEAVCESCQAKHQFNGQFRGTIQNCPSCGRYMDVGGVEEEFEWPESFDVE